MLHAVRGGVSGHRLYLGLDLDVLPTLNGTPPLLHEPRLDLSWSRQHVFLRLCLGGGDSVGSSHSWVSRGLRPVANLLIRSAWRTLHDL